MKLPKSIMMAAISILMLTVFAQGAFADTATSQAVVRFGDLALLKLDAVPDFDFGQHVASADPQIYTAIDDALLRVKDDGSQTPAWTVKVKGSTFTEINVPEGNTPDTLDGAQIYLNQGVIAQVLSTLPALLGNPVMVNPIIINADDSADTVKVASATGELLGLIPLPIGAGQWEGTWTNTNIELHVPAASAKATATYTSTLSWTLEDTP